MSRIEKNIALDQAKKAKKHEESVAISLRMRDKEVGLYETIRATRPTSGNYEILHNGFDYKGTGYTLNFSVHNQGGLMVFFIQLVGPDKFVKYNYDFKRCNNRPISEFHYFMRQTREWIENAIPDFIVRH